MLGIFQYTISAHWTQHWNYLNAFWTYNFPFPKKLEHKRTSSFLFFLLLLFLFLSSSTAFFSFFLFFSSSFFFILRIQSSDLTQNNTVNFSHMWAVIYRSFFTSVSLSSLSSSLSCSFCFPPHVFIPLCASRLPHLITTRKHCTIVYPQNVPVKSIQKQEAPRPCSSHQSLCFF